MSANKKTRSLWGSRSEAQRIYYQRQTIKRLEQENEKLKKQYCERTDCCGRLGNSKKVEELIKENEKLKEENFNLREGIYIEKMSFPSEGRNFKELMEMPTYEELKKENEKLNHYKLLYQKVKDRNDKAIEYIEENCWLSAMKEFNCLESGEVKYLVEILKGNNEIKE